MLTFLEERGSFFVVFCFHVWLWNGRYRLGFNIHSIRNYGPHLLPTRTVHIHTCPSESSQQLLPQNQPATDSSKAGPRPSKPYRLSLTKTVPDLMSKAVDRDRIQLKVSSDTGDKYLYLFTASLLSALGKSRPLFYKSIHSFIRSCCWRRGGFFDSDTVVGDYA